MIIKGVILLSVVVLIIIFLADPAMAAGRAVKRRFKEIWENKEDE